MKPEGVSQFDWDRYLLHDEIMAAIHQRGAWVRSEMRRRFQRAMLVLGGAGALEVMWVLVFGGDYLWVFIPLVALLMTAATTIMTRARPLRPRRRWNDDHPQMGQYLAADLTD